ncbi:MAG: aminoglycoside phosphotransferase family protein [Deltaproteobacteria bacterium]|nr:aminoglycoside phosphotransferase family protein [Nannocystaceae bacterium]
MSARAPASIELARNALAAWALADARVAPLHGGLINDTFAVDADSGAFVLQRVHPVFPAAIHDNIAAVTERLIARGVATPTLIPTTGGALFDAPEGATWRLMTRMPGVSFARVHELAQAHAAAGLLARFHEALVDLPHVFVGMRTGVHDTSAHLHALERAIDEHRDHRLYTEVAWLGEAIARGARRLPALGGVPERIVHGDPKLANVMFEGEHGEAAMRASCLVDLDTVGPMALHLELGDMWRSWCNRRGEDEREAALDLGVFEAALAGYAGARAAPLAEERAAALHGLEWITLELAARFAADALHERYFGWDPARFSGRGEHCLVRALGQWSLHRQVLASRPRRAELLRAAWA